MKNKIITSVCSYGLFVSLTASCSLQSNDNKIGKSEIMPQIDNNTTVVNLQEFDKGQVISYSDLYSQVKYIPLESTHVSVIGNIDNLFITNNKEYIVHDRHNGKVLRFSPTGKFLNKIGEKGNGRNEYINPYIVQYDKYNNQVIVFDNYKKNFMYYDINGKLFKINNVKMIAMDFCCISKDYLAVYVNYGDNLKEKKTGYNFKILNHEGEVIAQFDSYDKSTNSFAPACEYTFHESDSTILCNKPFTNVIYRLTSTTIEPLFYLDFGKKSIPQEWLVGKARKFREKLEQYKELAFCKKYTMHKDVIDFEIVKNHTVHLCRYNLRDNRIDLSGRLILNDILGLIGELTTDATDGENVYKIIDPSRFIEAKSIIEETPVGEDILNNPKVIKSIKDQEEKVYDSIKEKKIAVKEEDVQIIYSMSGMMNPIIQICTLK